MRRALRQLRVGLWRQIIPALQASMFYNPSNPGRWPRLRYRAPLALELQTGSSHLLPLHLFPQFRALETTIGIRESQAPVLLADLFAVLQPVHGAVPVAAG